jgi:hypothetical protein
VSDFRVSDLGVRLSRVGFGDLVLSVAMNAHGLARPRSTPPHSTHGQVHVKLAEAHQRPTKRKS